MISASIRVILFIQILNSSSTTLTFAPQNHCYCSEFAQPGCPGLFARIQVFKFGVGFRYICGTEGPILESKAAKRFIILEEIAHVR